MRIVCKFGLVVMLAACTVPSRLAACNVHLTVVASERVKARATTARTTELLCAIAAQLGLDPDQARIVLVQIRPDEAGAADVTPANPIHEVHAPGQPGFVYMVWLIGDADDTQIAGLLGSALADSLGVRPPPQEFNAAVRRAVLFTRTTVNKNALLKSSR